MNKTNIICLITCLTAVTNRAHVLKEVLRLHDNCAPLYVDVTNVEVEIHSTNYSGPRSARMGTRCQAFIKTATPLHGLCVHVRSVILFQDSIRLLFTTGPVHPDVVFARGQGEPDGLLCFPSHLLAISVLAEGNVVDVEQAVHYTFTVTTKPRAEMHKRYFMDSFTQCGLSHVLDSTNYAIVESMRTPAVTSHRPDVCSLTFTCNGNDQYEEVCITLSTSMTSAPRRSIKNTEFASIVAYTMHTSAFQILGLNERFYSNGEALKGVTSCSRNKRLTVILNRTEELGLNFVATVSKQRHPHWNAEDDDRRQLRGLRIVKGITYFIATIDSLIAFLVAVLAAILRKPNGPWQHWFAETNTTTARPNPPSPFSHALVPRDAINYGTVRRDVDVCGATRSLKCPGRRPPTPPALLGRSAFMAIIASSSGTDNV